MILLIGILLCCVALGQVSNEKKNPIVFVYTVDDTVCMGDVSGWSYRRYFPHYLVHSLNQAAFTQRHCDVYFVSNFKKCKLIDEKITSKVTNKIIKVDVTEIPSVANRSSHFLSASEDVFMGDSGSLWIASAMRFFLMQDLMDLKGWQEMVHAEGDNMLYVDTATIVPHLRQNFGKALAVTPLLGDRSTFTASILWVGSYDALNKFTNFLMELATKKTDLWGEYLQWLKPYACCKMKSGLLEDQFGRGLKPHKIEEMTMMAFYRYRQRKLFNQQFEESPQTQKKEDSPKVNSVNKELSQHALTEDDQLHLFPVLPPYNYHFNKFTCNMSDFARGGIEMKAFRAVKEDSNTKNEALKSLIYDPGSYGQNLGGTNSKGGRNKGFKDGAHVVGQALRLNSCKVTMLCGTSPAIHPWLEGGMLKNDSASQDNDKAGTCYAAPYVKCGLNKKERLAALAEYREKAVTELIEANPTKYPEGTDREKIIVSEEIRTQVKEWAVSNFWRGETTWHPVFNLHIHAKRTQHYLSENWPCSCQKKVGLSIDWAPGLG